MIKFLSGLFLLQIIVCSNAFAGEIRQVTVEYDKGVYTINFDATVTAPREKVFDLLTDYDQLHRISDSILESAALDTDGDSNGKSRILLNSCILFFCRKAVLVEHISTIQGDEITATVDPLTSDFKSGESHWKFLSLDNQHTRIELHKELEPGFWYPPVIGPWLVKKKMIQELTIMLERLEQLANENSR